MTGQEGAAADEKQHGQARQQPPLKDEPQIQKAAADKRQDERSTADKELRWTKIGAVLSGAATFLLVVFGGIGTALVYGQLRAMRESNRITQESNDRTLAAMQESNKLTRDSVDAAVRAFRHEGRARVMAIKFDSGGTHPVYGGGSFATVVITVRNVGNSDAIVTVRGELGFSRFIARLIPERYAKFADIIEKVSNVPPRPNYADLPESEYVEDVPVRRGETVEFRISRPGVFGKHPEPPELEAFDIGALQAHAVGYMLSRDELGETRYTYICASIDATAREQGNWQVKKGETPEYREWTWVPCWNNNLEIQEHEATRQ